jgi:uncharacterized protein YgiB involved in biofilm formation
MSKRSQLINLSRMRKVFSIKPLAMAVAATSIAACGDSRQDAVLYTSVDDCKETNPEYASQCQTAYQQALAESQRTGPKYNNRRDCEVEFGTNQCYQAQNSNGSFFMPFMAGFMLNNLISSGTRYYSQPLYTSYSPYSRYRNSWFMGDGRSVGNIDFDYYNGRSHKKLRVPSRSFDPKPTVSRTIERGGFGSSVRAKSNWGSSSRSWGG